MKITNLRFSALGMAGFLVLLLDACSVVPKQTERLSGLRKLAEWKASLPEIKNAGASAAKYAVARTKVNSLISPVLETEVDSVANESLFGLGGTVDLSESAIIDPGTTSAVNDFINSKPTTFGANGLDSAASSAATAAATAVLTWANQAASEARQKSAKDLKTELGALSWPAWSELP